jgi:hypothetical protein
MRSKWAVKPDFVPLFRVDQHDFLLALLGTLTIIVIERASWRVLPPGQRKDYRVVRVAAYEVTPDDSLRRLEEWSAPRKSD